MSVGSDITRRMNVQRYRRNEGDRWPWQDDLAFVTKNGIGHEIMRAISTVVTKRLAGFASRCAIRWRCMSPRVDTSCRIKDRATSSVSGFT